MGTGIRLTNRQWDDLDHLRNRTGSADVFRNCSILLLSDGGHSMAGIAQLLGCSPETVKRIRRLYRDGGLGALTPKRSYAQPPPLRRAPSWSACNGRTARRASCSQ